MKIISKGFNIKKTIESLTAVKPTPDPPAPIFDCLRFFSFLSGTVFY